jgi:hypothetical protein
MWDLGIYGAKGLEAEVVIFDTRRGDEALSEFSPFRADRCAIFCLRSMIPSFVILGPWCSYEGVVVIYCA